MGRHDLILCDSVGELRRPETLSEFLDASNVVVEPLETLGYSGSRFFRVLGDQGRITQTYFLKETVLASDWFSIRTDDVVGREAAVLVAPEIESVHSIFELPYKAIAMESGAIAMLMTDVSKCLIRDQRSAIDGKVEDLILDTLARLHAMYWEADLSKLGWLMRPEDFLHIMGPLAHDAPGGAGGSAREVDKLVRDGWGVALDLLPKRVATAITKPPREIWSRWTSLPSTLVHGDTKIANFAVMPDDRLCLLDWAFVGLAPCTFDLGWYVAVNAPRLTTTKEKTFGRYRKNLERHLGRTIDDTLWVELEEAGVICGALMLLWSKATGVRNERDGADSEWRWWVDRLERWASAL